MTPDDWKNHRLSECAEEITSGGTPKIGRMDYYGGDVPFLKIDDLTTNRGLYLRSANTSITEKALQETAAKLYPANTVLVTMYGTIGAVGITEVPMAANQAMAAFLGLKEVTKEFLAFLLSHEARALAGKAGQTTQSNINGRILKDHEVLLPPLAEQRKIAAILSSVDDAIEKTQAVIDQVEVVKRGLMQELLTRGLPGRHTRFKQTEIGEIPQEWEVCDLSALCHRMFVGIAQAATHAYADEGVPIVRTTNVRENRLDMHSLLRITEEFAKEMKGKTLCAGDVLTARTGYPGTSVVVPESLAGGQCFTLLVSRPGPRLRSGFLCHTMNSDNGSRIVNRGQAGGAQQNLNVSVFKKAQLGVPSLEEQDAICDVLDACYAFVGREENRRGALCAIKTSLMSVLLTGELPVTPDPEP